LHPSIFGNILGKILEKSMCRHSFCYDDQVVPIADSAVISAKLVKGATLKLIPGAPHGMSSILKDQTNQELLGKETA
jgi:hypothetical protein